MVNDWLFSGATLPIDRSSATKDRPLRRSDGRCLTACAFASSLGLGRPQVRAGVKRPARPHALAAGHADVPYSCERRSHRARHLPLRAPPPPAQDAGGWRGRRFRERVLKVSCLPSRHSLKKQSPLNRGSSGQHGHFSTSVKRHGQDQASDRFSALDLPRILSALISKLTF